MIKTFTQDDIIRYVYGDISKSKSREIEKALICDAQLQEMYKDLLVIKRSLDESIRTPSNKVINNILDYSKSLNLPSNK